MYLSKRIKINIAILFALVIIIFAVWIAFSSSKTTVASILHLDSKEQIVKIEIGSVLEPEGQYPNYPEHLREWKDVTNTALGKRYFDALFSASMQVRTDGFSDYADIFTETAAIRITLGVSEDYPFRERSHTILVGWPVPQSEGTGYYGTFQLTYTTEEQMRLQEKLNAEGKNEIAKANERYTVILPNNELFTLDFINKQFE